MSGPSKAALHADPLLVAESGHTECVLGNEAIVRGALEAGVAFVAGYPGTPSSEVTDSFARLSASRGIVFEYSVNEKIAIEMAFAASLAGARSLCAMKHLGLMVAGDPLSTIPYVGVEAGMVIVSAGDPSCRTSPNEQDQRHLGPMLHIPVLDPSTPQEALAMTRFAFELSEACRLPVLLRPTTRVCHSRAQVTYGALKDAEVRGFHRNPRRYTPIPVNARRMRTEVDERLARAQELIADSEFFRCEGSGPLAVLAAGAPAATCADVVDELGLGDLVALWTLGALYPLPEAKLVERLEGVERLLVVEELSPYLEDAVLGLCSRHGLSVEVLGKRSGHLPLAFEYEPATIRRGLHDALGLGPAPEPARRPLPVAPRPPVLCPSCGHRSAYFAARAAFPDDQLFFNDIGCYTLGYGPPLNTVDALVCMGAGFTLAAGVARVTGKRTVGFLGDSTFYHSGMPALFNAVKERVEMVAVILDNQVTAMTGFQASPGTAHPGSIEAVVRALGVTQVETVDPSDLPAATAAFRRARDADGLSVVIAKRPCAMFESRKAGQAERPVAYRVDPGLCRTCARQEQGLRCSQPVTPGYERHLAKRTAELADRPCEPGGAPCQAHCPLSLCIQGYAGHIAAGEYSEALGHILARTPLPEVVCRVCEHPCESACVRAGVDESVAVNDLKRFVVEWAVANGKIDLGADREQDHGRRVVVVGAGPSGLSAAHSLRSRGYDVTLLDAAERPGGLLSSAIPAYRMPREALERDVARILDQGVEFRGGVVLGRDVTVAGLLDDADALFLATGARRISRLELDGSDTAGIPVIEAVPYLEAFHQHGVVSTGQQVVVIGGGNVAIDAARTARRLGAEVTLACLESRQAMPALGEEILAAELEGVTLCPGLRPLRLESGGLTCAPVEAGAGRQVLLPSDHLLVAIGQEPDLGPLDAGGLVLARTADGGLEVDPETSCTSDPRVFAGGDLAPARPGERTVTAAMAAGLRAAWAIDRSLRGPEAADRIRPPAALDAAPARLSGEGVTPDRAQPPQRPATDRGDFAEVVGVLTETQARVEASRCLACGQCGNCRACIDVLGCPAIGERDGHAQIDEALCTGCGVCADMCPNQAIQPVRV